MYFSWGFPKALATGAGGADGDAVALAASPAGDYVLAVHAALIQVWAGGQHRVKLGELRRSAEAVVEEGPNTRAHWCPQKRVLAVAVRRRGRSLAAACRRRCSCCCGRRG